MDIGNKAPAWRIPAITKGQLSYRPLQPYGDKRLVLCCLSSLRKEEARFFNSQTERFTEFWAQLAVFVSRDPLLKELPTQQLLEFDLPIFTDPLQRLSRTLKLSRALPPNRCETLFFDHQCRLEFRLIHDLNLRGILLIQEMVESLNCQPSFSESREPKFDSELVQPHFRGTKCSTALQD